MIEKIKIPVDIQSKADILVKRFIEKKIYPFNDIVWAIRKGFDEDTAENILPAIKMSYYAYLSDATDAELEKMSSVDFVKSFGTVEGAIKPKEEIKEGFIKEIEKVDLSSYYKPFNEKLKEEIKKQEIKEVILPPQLEMRVTKDYIQWRSSPKEDWKNLILIERLKGDQGDKGDKGESGERGPQGKRSIATTQSYVTKAEIEKVLTGLIQTHYHPGGGGVDQDLRIDGGYPNSIYTFEQRIDGGDPNG